MDAERTLAIPFAALLRRYRLASGLSQEELAERAGLSVQAISSLERGIRRAPYRETVALLAHALSLTEEQRDRLDDSVPRRRAAIARTAPLMSANVNLPLPGTSFIGREREVNIVLRLLGTSRLLTLTGAGGVGKTRLAMQIAAGIAPDYADGVRAVELAPLADPTLVPLVIAQSFGILEQPDRGVVEMLAEALRDRSALLILDNCEHLRAASADLAATLMRSCPQLSILATSREALGVIGETVWRVPSMALPSAARESGVGCRVSAGSSSTPDSRLPTPASDAVRLFVDRAATAHAAFELTESNIEAVEAICRRLDGIPLAIELAAARSKILTAEQIAARLDDRFRLLTGGGDAVPLRQRTLRGALDWSYDLLTAPERRLLERLAVFAGGCGIEAAEAVCVGGAIEIDGLFDLLSSLVEKSLLLVEYHGAAARYRLLETVRQYAGERLAAMDEDETVRRRHGEWVLEVARQAESHLRGPDQAAWLDRLDAEHDNVRAALRWSLESGAIELGLRVGAAMREFWRVRGHLSEAAQWLESLLPRGDTAPADVRAAALHAAAMISHLRGELGRGQELAEAALGLSRETGDPRLIATTLHYLGVVVAYRSDNATAAALFQESLALAREIGDPSLIRPPLYNLGTLDLSNEQSARARTRFEEALELARGAGDLGGTASALTALGFVARHGGSGQAAREHYTEALRLRRRLGDRAGIANTVRLLADLETSLGDLEAARAHAEEALAVAREIGHGWGVVSAYDVLTYVARTRGDLPAALEYARAALHVSRTLGDRKRIHGALWEYAAAVAATGAHHRAVRVFAASEALRASIGFTLGREHVDTMERTMDAVRVRIGDDEDTRAWAEGAALSPDSAIEYALRDEGSAHEVTRG